MTAAKGVHDILTLQGLASASPAKRAGLMNELARLEHQRALLERQEAVWAEQRRIAERRLGLVHARIERVRGALRVAEGDGADPVPGERRRNRPPKKRGEDGTGRKIRRTMQVEY